MTGRTRACAAAALLVATLAGCSSSSDDANPSPSRTSPPPSGTGPYPTPDNPSAAEPLPSGSAGTPRGGLPADVDQDDATELSRAALQVMWTHDTRIDTSRADAGRRLADTGWCTATYADQLREHTPRASDATWTQWAEREAYTTVKISRAEEAGRPSDTKTTAYRQWSGTLTPKASKWRGDTENLTAFVELRRPASSDPWRVSAITIQ